MTTSDTTTRLSAQLAHHAVHADIDHIPAEVRLRATHLMLDALGIALASTQWDFARQTLAGLRELAGPAATNPSLAMARNCPCATRSS
ncbi:mmgE/PrpD family domain protein [Bordetella holmesii 70147]|nr:mmgE/PrpD family domain protein [Bordetella holmesii 70147]